MTNACYKHENVSKQVAAVVDKPLKDQISIQSGIPYITPSYTYDLTASTLSTLDHFVHCLKQINYKAYFDNSFLNSNPELSTPNKKLLVKIVKTNQQLIKLQNTDR